MAHLSIVFSRRVNTTVFVSFHYIRTNKVSFDVGHIPPCVVPVSGVHVPADGVFSIGLFYDSSSAEWIIQRLL
jgi:hypothetical protein